MMTSIILNETDEKYKKCALYFKKEHPDHVPIIMKLDDGLVSKCDQSVKREFKYIVDHKITMSHLLFRIRKASDKIISPSCGLIAIIPSANIMVTGNSNVFELYQKYKNQTTDILHVTVTKENVFG